MSVGGLLVFVIDRVRDEGERETEGDDMRISVGDGNTFLFIYCKGECVCVRERERDSCGESKIRPDGERVRESKKERERKGE